MCYGWRRVFDVVIINFGFTFKGGKMEEDEIGSLGIAEKVKNVEATAEMTYVDLLVIGMKKEKDSFQLYKQLASTVRKDQLKDMFQQMAREEAQHKLTLEIEYDLTTF